MQLSELKNKIVKCKKCPRLVKFRNKIAREKTAKSVTKIDIGAKNANVINAIPLGFITGCYHHEE